MPDAIRGPRGRPLLGHAASMSRGGLTFLRACASAHGDLVPLRWFRQAVLFVNHPDYIGQVLATHHGKVGKGPTRQVDRVLLGAGLSLREGDQWRRERRIMQPAFHRERLPRYGEVVVALAERLSAPWREGDRRDLHADMTQLSLAIVARTMFGVDVWDDLPELAAALASAMTSRAARARSWQVLFPDFVPLPASLRVRQARRQVDVLLQRAMDQRRLGGAAPGDLLGLLLGDDDPVEAGLTDQQVKDDVMTVFVGGTETVADLLTWVWYLLSRHPSVETRLLAELDVALGGRLPTVADLTSLPYLAMIVTEALRLKPPASVLAREALAEFDLGPVRVNRGTALVVSPWVMHRDPRYFAAPDSFDPDRWAAGEASRLPRYAYFPFGAGPRRCIGMSFATMEAILVVASIARRFRFELAPGQPVVAEPIPTLRPKNGLSMVVRERENAAAPSRRERG